MYKDYFEPNLIVFSFDLILYGGLAAQPINTEIPGMTLLFLEYHQDFKHPILF